MENPAEVCRTCGVERQALTHSCLLKRSLHLLLQHFTMYFCGYTTRYSMLAATVTTTGNDLGPPVSEMPSTGPCLTGLVPLGASIHSVCPFVLPTCPPGSQDHALAMETGIMLAQFFPAPTGTKQKNPRRAQIQGSSETLVRCSKLDLGVVLAQHKQAVISKTPMLD